MEIKGVVIGCVSGVMAYKGWSESPVVGKTPVNLPGVTNRYFDFEFVVAYCWYHQVSVQNGVLHEGGGNKSKQKQKLVQFVISCS
jgi:hypothetical protein